MILEFEKSSSWPDSLEAINRTKVLFLNELSKSLLSNSDYRNCQISRKDIAGYLSLALSFQYKKSIKFVCEIACDKERQILETSSDSTGMVIQKANNKSLKLFQHRKVEPYLRSLVDGLVNSRSSFGVVVELFKRFLNANQVRNHYNDLRKGLEKF